jgi:ADP-heptose:LPS heptosyltransferase
MNKKAKISGRAGRLFYHFFGNARTKSVLTIYFRKKFRKTNFSFPVSVASIKNILVILPEQQLEILHQIKNLLSIVSTFKDAKITVFCLDSSVSIVKLIPNIDIVEYKKSEIDGFASQLSNFAELFKNVVDICILLDRNPQLSILSLVGSTNASIRAGYHEAGEYPFLNLRTRVSNTERYLTDKNCAISELFGKQTETLHISVAKKMLDEIDNHLNEMKISNNHGLLGIDAIFFLNTFGKEWTALFLQNLQQHCKCTIYGFIDEEPSADQTNLLKSLKIPFIVENSAPRIAALIYRSNLIISGNTIFYGLAALLNKSAIGFFTSNEFVSYCPNEGKQNGLVYKETPDSESIKNVAQLSGKVIFKSQNSSLE